MSETVTETEQATTAPGPFSDPPLDPNPAEMLTPVAPVGRVVEENPHPDVEHVIPRAPQRLETIIEQVGEEAFDFDAILAQHPAAQAVTDKATLADMLGEGEPFGQRGLQCLILHPSLTELMKLYRLHEKIGIVTTDQGAEILKLIASRGVWVIEGDEALRPATREEIGEKFPLPKIQKIVNEILGIKEDSQGNA